MSPRVDILQASFLPRTTAHSTWASNPGQIATNSAHETFASCAEFVELRPSYFYKERAAVPRISRLNPAPAIVNTHSTSLALRRIEARSNTIPHFHPSCW
jgi:hypothetical protein